VPVTVWVTAAGVAVTAWLLLPPPREKRSSGWRQSRSPVSAFGDARARRALPAAPLGVLAAVVVGGLLVLLDGRVLALALIGLAASLGGGRLAASGRARRLATRRADRVLEACETLAGELRAGQPPSAALRQCVDVWPEIDPVAAAAALGADVPRALRRLAALPGASGLGEVAAAWQVSEISGSTMAVALGRVTDAARRRRASQQLVAAELASAQATARLVGLLPFAVLAMGSGLGGDPWGFLLRNPVGLVCLGAGGGLLLLGLAWIERIAASVVDP
jgi:tight adherence protein B